MPQFSEIAIATTKATGDRAPLTTCADCPYFAPDQGVHGWCQAFDKPARSHHEKTKACDQEIEVLEHNSYITQPTTGGQQSEIEHPPYPAQSYKRSLTERERHVIAAVLGWDSHCFVGVQEILGVEEVQGRAWVNLTKNRTMPIAVSMLSSVQQSPSSDHWSQDDIEIDSDDNPVTPTYRVWFSWHLLGTFHRSPVDNRWLTNPTYGRDFERHTTSEQAIAVIAAAWDCAQQLRKSDLGVSL